MSAAFVEATVVRAQSPTSVRAGDRATIGPDGEIDGFVGGTCAQSSVRLYSLRALQSGEAVLLRILPGAAEGEPEASEGVVTVKNPCLSGGALEIFLQPRLPAATVRIVGATPIALALEALGTRLGYSVERDEPVRSRPRGSDAAVVVASHGRDEERVLTEALDEGVPYVGLVASEKRGEAVRGSLDIPEELRRSLRTPAGLQIHAESPEEIALSILAEIVAMRAAGAGLRPVSPGAAPPVDPAPASAETASAEPAPLAVATDPMCGMEVAVSPASIQLERDGETYYFCSEGCRDGFAAQGAHDAAVR